ncbi:uncharacterized protein LOC108914628 [Anoplophora glabripennis]|uniref:uncharacterized protein LOC108914628 n=1 Tax=Anoplophora glabripennis TaxID=217634 RepID=UPI0008759057|nr:uncharacterized protein LOC108914628 [Anoplophora glabripennis]
MDTKKKYYKYCIVPGCKNTSVSTPNKIFISLPSDENVRKLWQQSMRREKFVSNKGTKFCCEDHFNVEEDMENYMYYKTMRRGKIQLKSGVIPHIFKCQEDRKSSHKSKPRQLFLKRKNNSDDVRDSCVMIDTQSLERTDNETAPETSTVQGNKYVQVNLKPFVRSKSIQCILPCTSNEVSNRSKRKQFMNTLKLKKIL